MRFGESAGMMDDGGTSLVNDNDDIDDGTVNDDV